jgi:hypothetical protein
VFALVTPVVATAASEATATTTTSSSSTTTTTTTAATGVADETQTQRGHESAPQHMRVVVANIGDSRCLWISTATGQVEFSTQVRSVFCFLFFCFAHPHQPIPFCFAVLFCFACGFLGVCVCVFWVGFFGCCLVCFCSFSPLWDVLCDKDAMIAD